MWIGDDVLAPLRDWQLAGIWDLIHFALLDWLARGGLIDWSRAIVDSCSVRAVCDGLQTGPNPTDRAKRGSKRHLICDAHGMPLAIKLTERTGTTRKRRWRWWMRFPRCQASVHDRGVGPIVWSGIAATMRRRFEGIADSRHIVPLLAMRRTAHGSGLGRWRWVVERTFAWLNQFRRLRVRYDKRADIHEAFLSLGCALICWQSLRRRWLTG